MKPESLDEYEAGSKRTRARPCKTKNSYRRILCLRLFRLTFGSRGFGSRSILGSGNVRLLKLDVVIKDGKRLGNLFTQFVVILNPKLISFEQQAIRLR